MTPISAEAILYEAGLALAEAQKEFEQDPKQHRLLLITDDHSEVVGKLSQLDISRALKLKGEHIESSMSLSSFGVSRDYPEPMLKQWCFWEQPLMDLGKANHG